MPNVEPKHDTRSLPHTSAKMALSTSPPANRSQDEIVDHVANVLLFLLSNDLSSGLSLKDAFMMLERKVLSKALRLFNGHQAHAADFLQVLPTTLSAKIRRYGIDHCRHGVALTSGPIAAQVDGPSPQESRAVEDVEGDEDGRH